MSNFGFKSLFKNTKKQPVAIFKTQPFGNFSRFFASYRAHEVMGRHSGVRRFRKTHFFEKKFLGKVTKVIMLGLGVIMVKK